MGNEVQFWKDYSYVVRGKQRIEVIKSLEKPMTVTQVRNATELSLSEASRVVRSFEKVSLAKCLNPKDITGRVYELTERGRAVREGLFKGRNQ